MQNLKNKANQIVGKRDTLKEQELSYQEKLDSLALRKEAIELAQVLIQQTAKDTQEQLKFHIEDLVQTAMDAVFPGVYTFHLDFELKRGRTEGRIYLDKDGEELDPKSSCGGGVVDLVSFALRLAALSISTNDKLLIMDEGFKWVSAGLRPIVAEMMKGLADKLGVQIIMVTHDEIMMEVADRIFKVSQKQRRSLVEVS